ncbi:MAG: CDP-alcohol phosphatidyltransferase family protein [Deltaproteobacteria bacterium]|nr:CDP-alcohol phosphatidyltransferase family protein [Deltaproteobacteria bacterium]
MSNATAIGTRALLRDLKTIPNQLSLSRVFLSVAAIWFLGNANAEWVMWLSLASAIVDILDGLIARKLGQTTELGAILDRATDLMMESVAFFALVVFDIIPFWLLFVYLFREFIVTAVRMYMYEIAAPVPKSSLGQRKTNFLMGGFCFAINYQYGFVNLGFATELGQVLGWIGIAGGLLFSYASMAKYLRAFARSYRGT